jgi:hypothetical protein
MSKLLVAVVAVVFAVAAATQSLAAPRSGSCFPT